MEDEKIAPARHGAIGFATTWAVAIGFTCIVVGQLAAQFAGLPAGPVAEAGAAPPQFNAIDYFSTGAIKAKPLSPCGPRADGP
jgi:hypothetical protein